ncbi:MAG: hypothetical protein IKX86_07050 [Clostridia bacterium]|nr:hypothetical protein [Clostridia bacterium]MBR5768411.1 hypothetical protein [Clostridia bacterium]
MTDDEKRARMVELRKNLTNFSEEEKNRIINETELLTEYSISFGDFDNRLSVLYTDSTFCISRANGTLVLINSPEMYQYNLRKSNAKIGEYDFPIGSSMEFYIFSFIVVLPDNTYFNLGNKDANERAQTIFTEDDIAQMHSVYMDADEYFKLWYELEPFCEEDKALIPSNLPEYKKHK